MLMVAASHQRKIVTRFLIRMFFYQTTSMPCSSQSFRLISFSLNF